MTVRMRHTKGHSGRRRSHHALSSLRVSTNEQGNVHLRHRVDMKSGIYRGKQVLGMSPELKASMPAQVADQETAKLDQKAPAKKSKKSEK